MTRLRNFLTTKIYRSVHLVTNEHSVTIICNLYNRATSNHTLPSIGNITLLTSTNNLCMYNVLLADCHLFYYPMVESCHDSETNMKERYSNMLCRANGGVKAECVGLSQMRHQLRPDKLKEQAALLFKFQAHHI